MKYDLDRSGFLDYSELRKALETVAHDGPKQAKELLAKYDKDDSGKMEYPEFKELCTALEAVNINLAEKELQTAMKGVRGRASMFSKVDNDQLTSAIENAKNAGVDATAGGREREARPSGGASVLSGVSEAGSRLAASRWTWAKRS